MERSESNGGRTAIIVLGITVIILTVAAIVLAVVLPHNDPDDIINYPLNANDMAIENQMDKGMVQADAADYVVVAVNAPQR